MRLNLLWLSLSLLALSPAAWTQNNNEAGLPITIEADSLVAQEQQGISLYQGDVVATQGRFSLQGEQLEITHPNQQLERLHMSGKPAQFKRYLEQQQAWVSGHADTIIYHAQSKQIELIGNAYIEQEGTHTISGPTLYYDLNKETLQANGSVEQPGRVSVTITPQ
ncbi:MAG: lipopolysaccharide transport periplasmic protein LptA [Thiomicrospira sp.]|jgi:lipopolysaccharide export system protein LptA|nr:lipopolysaccharide transport periplasmic protein LptA [Thiomicrospira sp.]